MKHIFIVEDDTTFAVMLQTWLTKKGFSVTSVSNMAAAKKELAKISVDLLLCDLRLPDGEGIDLLEWQASMGMNVPLIVMTSYAAIPSAVHAMKLGAQDYVAKPINPEELLKKINEGLGSANGNEKKATPKTEPVDEELHFLEGQGEPARKHYS